MLKGTPAMKITDWLVVGVLLLGVAFCAAMLDEANVVTPALRMLYRVMSSSAVVGIIVVILSSTLAFKGYKRQKMRDEVAKLYLLDGVEALLNILVRNLNIIENNYSHALYIVRDFRDNPEDNFADLFNRKYAGRLLPVDISIDKSYYRTMTVMGSEPFGELVLSAIAEFKSNNEIFASEIPVAVTRYIEEHPGLSKEEFLDYLDQ